jgi:hypothetical protein
VPAHDAQYMVALRGGAARVGGRALHPILLSNRLPVIAQGHSLWSVSRSSVSGFELLVSRCSLLIVEISRLNLKPGTRNQPLPNERRFMNHAAYLWLLRRI